ncbi:hypothetical protein QA640_40205 [Bradyrhizobium sp. CB82]|uniref:hypothetical protein n=1 Tax=Bradyrhizobium sp. CB82 TaxID=3039159 RepID=UPI0024B20064|nr:hypothetical protein [Bradyrhizobium sp. CB82]WFU40340.1 hypothetical protein QA640_40205 [Bradyrhizobium sp. CB82]
MSSAVRSFRVELIETYPALFQQPADYLGAAQGFVECDAGWHAVLDRLFVRIRIAVQADGGPFKFSQIKEKYGRLQLYWTGEVFAGDRCSDQGSHRAGRDAQRRDRKICGDEGRLHGGAWLTARCAAQAEGRPAVGPRVGFDNMHIVRHFVDGKSHVTCRRYDRETDFFLSVDPASVGIEE